MALEQSANFELLIDGQVLITLQTIKVNGESGKNIIDTLRGLSGFNRGSAKLTITGTAFIPAGGLEFNFHNAALSDTTYSLMVTVGDDSFTTDGQFMTSELGQSTNAAAEADFTFVGEFVALE